MSTSSSIDPSIDPAPPGGFRAGWVLTVYADAREAGGTFVGSVASRRSGVRGEARDPERSRLEAGRRARGRLRRYCATNWLNRLGTLTYRGEGCHDPRQVRADVGEFFRSLRGALGGNAYAYVWVPEWHKTGHGLHAHFAVGRYVKRGLIAEAWGRGFVHIKLLGDMPVGSGKLEEARRAAGYLSKYVTRSFGDTDRPAGLHRYDLAQGFTPKATRLQGISPEHVIGQASELFGAEPSWRAELLAPMRARATPTVTARSSLSDSYLGRCG